MNSKQIFVLAATASSVLINGDKMLCVQDAPEAAPAPINVIDNVAAT
jgi:hypothetical protein